jgi:DNA-directed RNA polymerase sigma subunit (sigma70/sigma32)
MKPEREERIRAIYRHLAVGWTLEEIGNKLNLSGEMVRQTQRRIKQTPEQRQQSITDLIDEIALIGELERS